MNFTEYINLSNAKKVMSLSYEDFVLKFSCKEWEDEDGSKKYSSKTYYNQIIKWLKKLVKINKSSYKQRYKYSRNQTNGRIYVKGMGIQSCCKLLKNYLLEDIELYDYDMENAHFVILNYLCKKHNIKNDFINSYTSKRKEILKQGNISKLDMILFLYNDNYYNKDISKEFFDELNNAKIEINKLEKHLINDITSKSKNPKSALLSKILCYYENEILQQVINEYECNVPYYDGFISKQKININKLNEITKEYNVKWSIKSLENKISLKDCEIEDSNMIDKYISFFDEASQYDIACYFVELLDKKEQGKWIFYSGDRYGMWYSYDDNNILSQSKTTPLSLLKRISTLFKEKNEKIHYSSSKCHGVLTEKSVEIDKKLVSINKMMGNNSTKKQIVEELKILFNNQSIVEKIDSNNDIIAFKDKIYDFKNEEARNIRKDDFVMNHINYNYPSENSEIMEEVDKVITSIFDKKELKQYFYDSITYSLFTNRFEKFNIWTGCGSNGKGILLNLLEKTLGNYLKQPNSQFLTSSVEGANSSLVQCKGKKIVMVSEPENDRQGNLKFNMNFIKKLTGRDTIAGRALHNNEIEFKPLFTLFCQCNQIPSIENLDNANKRRFVILPFLNKFVSKEQLEEGLKKNKKNLKLRDDTLKDRINNDDEFSKQFMMILIKHSKGLYNKTLFIPDIIKNQLKSYFESNDVVNQYIEDTFDIIEDDDEKKQDDNLLKLNDIYCSFKDHESYNGMKKKDFTYNLLQIENIEKYRNGRGRYIIGLKFKKIDDEENHDEPTF